MEKSILYSIFAVNLDEINIVRRVLLGIEFFFWRFIPSHLRPKTQKQIIPT